MELCWRSSLDAIMLLIFVVNLTIMPIIAVNKTLLKEQTLEMFHHAFWSYMNHAYPADELMPLSCQGRIRGVTPSRGDVDDALGNFSLSLLDALDTLVVVGDYEEFETAVKLVVDEVTFDTDVVVSVFETNIRVVGGLLSGHLMAKLVQRELEGTLAWYDDHLLHMARDIAYRLLPAFDTQTGVPYPRVNLKYGLDNTASFLRHQHDTCTACAGTMILEFAALSRLTGDPIFEDKARTAMDFLWQQRHRTSDLMGTVLNVHSGDWIRKDSGVGAGIDSYYEYCLKAYILLGDESYLHRFNKHYVAVMKYVSQGPMMFDVHMHNPTIASRQFMDSLLAFWPGLQVLKGDLKSAIEMHEMLYQVIQRHNFLPEAFTHDFQVHWGQHPLRPEFVESTYFLYKATKDEHYLKIGEEILNSLNKHVRVKCGFAGVKDVRTMVHEDRMDSFVLAETFKYLYLLFADRDDLLFDIDNYIFTTEAHFLPLSVSSYSTYYGYKPGAPAAPSYDPVADSEENFARSCPNANHLFENQIGNYASVLRNRLKNFVQKNINGESIIQTEKKLDPLEFNPSDPEHIYKLKRMGISIITQVDGKMQLIHAASQASSIRDADDGMKFMQEMIRVLGQQVDGSQIQQSPRAVQILSPPFWGQIVFAASPAQFGASLDNNKGLSGQLIEAVPIRACDKLENTAYLRGKLVLLERGDCMFIEKVRNVQKYGAIGAIIIDHLNGTSSAKSALFAMSGDGSTDVQIPSVFLFRKEGTRLQLYLQLMKQLTIFIGEKSQNPRDIFVQWLKRKPSSYATKAKIVSPQKLACPKKQRVKNSPTLLKREKQKRQRENVDGQKQRYHHRHTRTSMGIQIPPKTTKTGGSKLVKDTWTISSDDEEMTSSSSVIDHYFLSSKETSQAEDSAAVEAESSVFPSFSDKIFRTIWQKSLDKLQESSWQKSLEKLQESSIGREILENLSETVSKFLAMSDEFGGKFSTASQTIVKATIKKAESSTVAPDEEDYDDNERKFLKFLLHMQNGQRTSTTSDLKNDDDRIQTVIGAVDDSATAEEFERKNPQKEDFLDGTNELLKNGGHQKVAVVDDSVAEDFDRKNPQKKSDMVKSRDEA